MNGWFWGMWLGLAGAACAAAAEPTSAPAQTPEAHSFISARYRFVVSARTPEETTEVGQWAERVTDQLERWTGLSVPFSGRQQILIVVRDEAAFQSGRVIREQVLEGRQLRQRLVLVNPGALDPDGPLENLCALLLGRCVFARQSGQQRAKAPGAVPDWLAIGMARNLVADIRQLDRDALGRHPDDAVTFSASSLVTWERLPLGYWSEKSACGLFVGWLCSGPRGSETPGKLVRLCANTKHITIDDLARVLFDLDDPAELESRWKLWLDRPVELLMRTDRAVEERMDALRKLLIVRPSEWGGDPAAPAISFSDLIRQRREEWAQRAAVGLLIQLSHLSLAQEEAFQRVTGLYMKFLEALGRPSAGGAASRWLHLRPSARQMRILLEEAENARVDLEQHLQQRATYLGRFESWQVKPSAESEGPKPPTTALRDYVDRAEQRLAP